MPALHVIDAARIFHETRRGFFLESSAPEITATWGDLPEVVRARLTQNVQDFLDGNTPEIVRLRGSTDALPETKSAADRLRIAVVNALRPFLEE